MNWTLNQLLSELSQNCQWGICNNYQFGGFQLIWAPTGKNIDGCLLYMLWREGQISLTLPRLKTALKKTLVSSLKVEYQMGNLVTGSHGRKQWLDLKLWLVFHCLFSSFFLCYRKTSVTTGTSVYGYTGRRKIHVLNFFFLTIFKCSFFFSWKIWKTSESLC